MPTDVFNNPSNDYINPGLSPCSGNSDEYTFEFLPKKEVGVLSGSEILQSMDLSDIEITITSWTSEKKYISAGEVIYVPGLTKGLTNRTQYFRIPDLSTVTNQEYFMQLDISINYYNNFRYYNINIESSANNTLVTDIDYALNINFGALGISVTSGLDVSIFTFTSESEGYEFNVTSALLTLIDASMDSSSVFDASVNPSTGINIPQTFRLIENSSSAIPSSKYPNGGMLGYMLKATYPTDTEETDRWFYMNNVKSPYVSYEAVDVSVLDESTVTYYNKFSKSVDVGMNGADTSTVMGASGYLDYINTNGLWDKVGDFRAHFSTTDPADSNIKNLVGGFYVFNPHDSAMKLEYMLINY